jgi:hypothetical protein
MPGEMLAWSVLAPPKAVRESLRILATHRAVFGSKRSRGWGISMTEADITRVVGLFEQLGARWVLVGAHAVGLLTEPRATADFDFIVEGRRTRAVIRALADAFGELDEQDIGAAIRLRAIDVDIIRSDNHALFREALDRAKSIGEWKIPPAEVVIVLKFMSAVSPWRNLDKRAQDMVDLRTVYHAVGADDLDRDYMIKLSASVYPGADREFAALLARIDQGEPIEL